MSRTDELFGMSLNSVLKQTLQPECIVVVDDNNDSKISEIIKNQIEGIENPSIHYIKNIRTKNMSGTGAWNTGVDYLTEKLGYDSFFAILDDDDSWDNKYLETVCKTINNNPDSIAVFAFLKRSDCESESKITNEDLTVDSFLIGNPGIQGSNMCFKIHNFRSIGGFDENLASCTDRDLMIRFLQNNDKNNISIIPQKLVNHFTSDKTVTSNFEKKKAGLDYFYKKYIDLFDFPVLDKSLLRAEKFFHYDGRANIEKLYRQTHPVLITGVCGFIGSHIAQQLISLGYSVVGIDDLSTGTIVNVSKLRRNVNFELHIFSLLDNKKLDELFDKYNFNAVLHCAALPRIKYSMDYPNESFCANVTATKKLAEISRKHHIKRFVFCSSSSVYGECQNVIMNENDDLRPISPYAKQKAEAEQILAKTFENSETILLIFRLFNVYGFSHQPTNIYSTLVNNLINNAIYNEQLTVNGNGMQKRDFTYVGDVVDAFVKALEFFDSKNHVNIINIGTGTNHSVNEVADYVSQITGRKYTIQINVEPSFTLADNSLADKMLNWKPQTAIISGLKTVYKQTVQNQIIAIGIAMHNNASTIRRCLKSALGQANCKRKLLFVLADDQSSDNWNDEIADLLNDERIIVMHLQNSNVVKTRNMINDYIKSKIGNVALIGRLDADDEYASKTVLAEIESIYDTENPDLILAGNYLRQNGNIIQRKNLAVKDLANIDYVLKRLKQMSENNAEGELPSCNLIAKPKVLIQYPDIRSGEDHALLVHYLINQDKYKLYFAEDLLLTIYNLGGNTTSKNIKTQKHKICREQLYKNTLELCKMKKESKRQ